MKKLALILASILVAGTLFGCGKKPTEDEKSNQENQQTTDDAKEQENAKEPGDTGLEPGTIFDSVADFNYDEGQSGPWQYYFSGDNGETFDPCGTFDDYGDGITGWHPWEGSYIGVGFNADMEGFLELNTDGVSTNFSNQMGVLAFEAPATGKYVLTAKVWNPWNQPCDVFTFKKADGTEILTQDMSEIVDIYAYVTPTDVELEKGELLYMYCNSTAAEWVSAYIGCTMVYEPTDDSVYTVPEVEAPEVAGVEPNFEQEAEYNAYAQFNGASAEGAEVPWVYASTADGTEFVPQVSYSEPTDWDEDAEVDAKQWYSEAQNGIGINCDMENYIELNNPGLGAEMTALGFKAPADGTYTVSGYAYNPWGATCDNVIATMNGEQVAAIDVAEYTKLPNEFSFDVEMKAGDIVYFYGPSNAEESWVSAYVSVFVNAAQ